MEIRLPHINTTEICDININTFYETHEQTDIEVPLNTQYCSRGVGSQSSYNSNQYNVRRQTITKHFYYIVIIHDKNYYSSLTNDIWYMNGQVTRHMDVET